MLKLNIARLTSGSKKKKTADFIRQNPALLNSGVVDNYAPWEQGKSGNRSGSVKLMNPVQLKAVCSGNASHPLMRSTFKMRDWVEPEEKSPAPAQAEEELIAGFSLMSLGR